MHIKFLRTGKSAKSAMQYLLKDRDNEGNIRNEVKVLRGDPKGATILADSLNFKHKYTSVVIAFSPDDMLKLGADREKIFNETLDLFEKVAFAGLDPGQYTYYAVSHGDHIHIIVPRVELTSGKSLNIAPPHWRKDFDLIRDYINDKYGLDRPDSLANERAINTRDLQYLKNKELKNVLNEYFLELIEKDLIRTSDDIKLELAVLGFEVARQGNDYITIIHNNQRIRLKGAIYGKGFDVDRIDIDLGKEEAENRRIRKERAKKTYERIKEICERRAQYNARRYKKDNEKIDILDLAKLVDKLNNSRDLTTQDNELELFRERRSVEDKINYLIDELKNNTDRQKELYSARSVHDIPVQRNDENIPSDNQKRKFIDVEENKKSKRGLER